jgi:sugar phosphate isomerase/epimerase
MMDNHWEAYCTLSLVHFMAFPDCQSGSGPVLESVTQIAEDDFFSGIEISWINDVALRAQCAELLRQTNMRVAFGAQSIILSGRLNLNSLDAAQCRHAVETLKPYIMQAAEGGSETFVVLSGPDPGAQQRAEANELLADSIRQLCAYGRQQGVKLALETFDRAVDKKALIGPAHEAAAFSRQIKTDFPDFGILYDMGHMPLLDEAPRPALTMLKPHLVHTHVGNCVRVPGRPAHGDNHPRFGFPDGENDVPQLMEFLRALFEVGYLREHPSNGERPWIGFEVKPQAGETSALILDNIKRAWREAWAEL